MNELRTSLTSPFGRKVRMALHVLGLQDRFPVRSADTRDEGDDLRQQNPLGKIPCLIVDGKALYDSRVILEYIDHLGGGGRLMPKGGPERFDCLTRACLADGVMDAAILMVYEGRYREEAQISNVWLSHQRGKIERALTALEADPPPPGRTDVASITLACALGYLDWRKPVEWRSRWPGLAAWADAFAGNEPAVKQTEVEA